LQIASLNWLLRGDITEHKNLYTTITSCFVAKELYCRLTKSREIEALQANVTLKIVEYIKEHPNAREAELVEFVRKQFEDFKQQVNQL
jgi:hypothetical protein